MLERIDQQEMVTSVLDAFIVSPFENRIQISIEIRAFEGQTVEKYSQDLYNLLTWRNLECLKRGKRCRDGCWFDTKMKMLTDDIVELS